MSYGNLLFVLSICLMVYSNSNWQTFAESSTLCLEEGSSVDVHCNISRFLKNTTNSSTSLKNWSIQWYHNGLALKNVTIFERANSHVTADRPGIFTCVKRSKSDSVTNLPNYTAVVQIAPKPIQSIIGEPIFTELPRDSRQIVKISWWTLASSENYSYALFYKWHEDQETWQKVDNLSGNLFCSSLKCTAYFDVNGNIFTDVSYYITTRNGNCEVRSQIWTVCIVTFRSLLLNVCTAPDIVVFLPPTLPYLRITTAYRRVTLSWYKDRTIAFRYWYNCSTSSSRKLVITKPSIHLTDKDFDPYKPYDKCVFCVSLQRYSNGKFSKPRCNSSRLYEEIPSEAPSITCTAESCPENDDGHTRNVTIAWKLPPVRTWNGVLTKLVVNYQGSSNVSKRRELPMDKLNSNKTVLVGLDKRQNYIISMQACTKRGCSKNGNTYKIEVSSSPDFGTLPSSTSSLVIVIYVAVALLLLIVLSGLVLWYRKKRSSQDQCDGLPHLEEPECQNYSAPDHRSEVCDKLVNNENLNDEKKELIE